MEGRKCVMPVEGERMKQLIKAVAYVECSAKYKWNVDKVFETAMLSLFTSERKQRKKRGSNCVII